MFVLSYIEDKHFISFPQLLSRNFELTNIRLILKISRNILNEVSQKLTKDFSNFYFWKLRNFVSFRFVKLRKLRIEMNIAVT